MRAPLVWLSFAVGASYDSVLRRVHDRCDRYDIDSTQIVFSALIFVCCCFAVVGSETDLLRDVDSCRQEQCCSRGVLQLAWGRFVARIFASVLLFVCSSFPAPHDVSRCRDERP